MKRTYTCRRCGERGHNRATCQRRIDPPRIAPKEDTAFSRAFPLLGTMPDVEVASAVGAVTATVASWRRRLGIPKPSRRGRVQDDPERRYPGIIARLGVDPDNHIAADYGISRERVRQFRARFNIPRNNQRLELPPDGIAMLGRTPDSHIAEFLDLPLWFVRRERIKAGIPVSSPEAYYERVISLEHGRVGVDSDRSIAHDLKIPVAQVVNYRRRHGIPPAVLSPRCEGFVPHDRERIARLFHEGRTDAEIAVELGTSAAVIGQIRVADLGLLRRSRQPRIEPDRVAEIHRRLDAGETPWRIATALDMNPSTVASLARRHRSKS